MNSGIIKYRFDAMLALLSLEALAIWFSSNSFTPYWFLLLLALITALFTGLTYFKIKPSELFKNPHFYDLIFFSTVVVVFSANVIIIPNVFVLIVAIIAYFFALKYLLRVIKREVSDQPRKNGFILAILLSLFFASNLLNSLLLNIQKGSSGLALMLISLGLFAFTFLISEYNFSKNKFDRMVSNTYSSVLAILITEAFLVFSFFSEKYPNIDLKPDAVSTISISTISLFLVLIYYCVWGLMIHKIEEKLNFRVIFEYVGITIVIAATLLFTIKWL